MDLKNGQNQKWTDRAFEPFTGWTELRTESWTGP